MKEANKKFILFLNPLFSFGDRYPAILPPSRSGAKVETFITHSKNKYTIYTPITLKTLTD